MRLVRLTVQVTIRERNTAQSSYQTMAFGSFAIDALVVVSTNERLAGFPARALARAMISARFGGNELLLSVGRRVGNVTERDAWRDFKFELL